MLFVTRNIKTVHSGKLLFKLPETSPTLPPWRVAFSSRNFGLSVGPISTPTASISQEYKTDADTELRSRQGESLARAAKKKYTLSLAIQISPQLNSFNLLMLI